MNGFPRTRPDLGPTYDQMAALGTVPLWEIYRDLVVREPTPSAQPFIWRYDQLRPLLLEAGARISAAEAERRVMLLKNPGLDRPAVAHTLVAGLQLVMPGETAPCHRHTQTALRFVLEGDAGYTAVDGARCTMERGDLILNPSWAWHDHANTGTQPLVWLDGLDVPLTNYLQATFAEDFGGGAQQPITRADNESSNLFAGGLALEDPSPLERGAPSPVNRYPYRRAREALEAALARGRTDPCHGVRLAYVNPHTGGDVLPTLSTHLQVLPAGFRGQAYRSTASSVFAVVEGQGSAQISTPVGKTQIEWRENDVFVVPNWNALALHTDVHSVLFSFSDGAALKNLGLLRTERLEGTPL